MKDVSGNELIHGQTVERVVASRATYVGHKYTVVSRKWDQEDADDSLVADGGFIQELLTVERSKEFKII